MFDKFGEMDSCKDINELAENLFNEGDTESIKAMAKENGTPGEKEREITERLHGYITGLFLPTPD